MHTISVTGGILAGGENRRMNGFPKGKLTLDGTTFLERIAGVYRQCFCNVYLSVHERPSYELPDFMSLVYDRFPDRRASMNGVYSLLSQLRIPVCIVPWDMPQINEELIRVLLERWQDTETRVEGIFYENDGGIQPFPGIYGLGCLSGMRRCMMEGEYSLRTFLRDKQIVTISLQDRPHLPRLTNVNTPEEYEQLRN